MLHNDFIKENFMINWLKNLLGFGTTTASDKESEDTITVSVKEDDVAERIKNNPNWPFPEGTGSPEINMNTGAWPFPTSIGTVNIDGQAADYLINVDGISTADISIDLSTPSPAAVTAPKNRKRRNLKKVGAAKATPAAKPATKTNTPAPEVPAPAVKLSPGPGRKRKSKK
jgi:hypothetical protein